MRNAIISEDLRDITAMPLEWERFAGKTVLISGANGFLPAYMVETLLYLNETRSEYRVQVIGVVRNIAKAKARFAHYLERDDLQLIVQDICQPLEIAGPVDFIIHAASQASPKYYGKDPVGTLSPNIFGTCHLLELARTKKAQGFLFFSSGEVYGEVGAAQVPTREDAYGYLDPVAVRSCYGESKRMGENMCVSWHHQYGVPAKIVRPFHTYGPGMALDDGRVFADFVADVVQGRDIVMMSDGAARRAFCYLADAVIGFFTVLLSGAPGEAYNIGNDRCEISIAELATLVAGLAPEGGTRVLRRDAAASGDYLKSVISRNSPDISKAKGLGWEPVTDLSQGFNKTIRSFL
jgi:nucleoside-diphosphate-sugar epimerase